MKIYIAAVFESRISLRPHRDALWDAGHEVVSSWLDEVQQPPMMNQEVFWRKLALKDLTEIRSADVLILDTRNTSPRGGKEVEFGFALGQFQGKLVYIVGPVVNVFHTLADKQFPSWEECVQYLASEHNTSGECSVNGGVEALTACSEGETI